MHKLLRILKHRWFDNGDARRALDDAALARLQSLVRASEARHSGEIRVCVEGGLPLSYLRRQLTARDRAVTLFGKLRVWDTAHNNGVLIYLLLAERAIEIIADRGLSSRVPAAQWMRLTDDMSRHFQQGQFEQGLAMAIAQVDELLAQHFALLPGETNPNELPDGVDLR